METIKQNISTLTTKEELLVLKAIKKLLQFDDAKGFEIILKEMYRACIFSDYYNDLEDRTNLACHFECLEELFIDLSKLDGFNDILPVEHYVTQTK